MNRRTSMLHFWALVGLYAVLLILGLRGVLWFILPRALFWWYCWRMAQTAGAQCAGLTVGSGLMLFGSLAVNALILRACWRFAREWRRYLPRRA